MSQSQYASALISVRLVVMDHYMANPVNSLDPLVSDFRGTQVLKIPVFRVFGRALLFCFLFLFSDFCFTRCARCLC